MKLSRFLKPILTVTIVAGLIAAGYFTKDYWLPLVQKDKLDTASENSISESAETDSPTEKVRLSDQAIANLRLTAKPLQPQTYWKTIQVPGMVVDRPGRSDRGVVSPATGVIAKIYHFPGEMVRPRERLFTIHLLSESLQLTQSDLFKATQNIKLAQAQRKRLAAVSGAVPEARVIEVDNQIIRLELSVKAYRQELLNRGLTPSQIDDVTQGKFIRETTILVPDRSLDASAAPPMVKQTPAGKTAPTYELQELKVELGQQVQAGRTLCLLANHRILAIEGRAFPDETPLLEKSVRERWPIKVDFLENEGSDWPPLDITFHIRHMANTIDPVNRTFGFLMPLENQSRVVEDEGHAQMLWRFRPGQKVRVRVRVEKVANGFVLPAEAVAHEGAEAFVFTQNVNTFERKSVRVLYQDRQHAVVANDGSLPTGTFVVQKAAAQLNRMVKAGTDDGVPKGYHIHADGSLHKNEDEAK